MDLHPCPQPTQGGSARRPPGQLSSAQAGHAGPSSTCSSLYLLQPTVIHSNSLDSDSPSVYSQDSPDQTQPRPGFAADGVGRDDGYGSRSPSPGAGSFLTRGGTFSSVGNHGTRPAHFVRQLDTPPASPPPPGSARDPAQAEADWDDGLPGYRKPTVKLSGRKIIGPGVGTMIRRQSGAAGGDGGVSDGSEEVESAGQRVAREEVEAQLARDELMEKRRVAAERAAAYEHDRLVDEQAQQAELVKGIESMLADQTQPHSPPTRFQLQDNGPLPPVTPPGVARAQPEASPPPPPPPPGELYHPEPRSYEPHNELEYINAPNLGMPVPAYEPPEQAEPSRGWTPLPPPFVPSEGPAAAEARRHPKEAFFSEARRNDFRQANGLDEDGSAPQRTPRAEDGALLAPGYSPRTVQPESPGPPGHSPGGRSLAPPPGSEEAYLGVRLSQGLQDQGYDPEWREPPPPVPSELQVGAFERRSADERAYRSSYQPPPRVFTPVEYQRRPVSAQPAYSGSDSPREEWRGQEYDYFGRGEYRQGGGGMRGPPVSSSGGASGYYRYGAIHEHAPYDPALFSPGGYPVPLGTAGLPHPSEFEYPSPSSRGHHQPYSPIGNSRRASIMPVPPGYGQLPPPPLPHPGYASASSFTHDPALLSPRSPSALSSGLYSSHPLSPSPSRTSVPEAEHAAWQHREFLRWQAEQALQRRRMDAEGEGQTHSSGSLGDSASVAGGPGKASRRESIKGLLKGLGVGGKGKGKEREGEFEEVAERTTILWGWT